MVPNISPYAVSAPAEQLWLLSHDYTSPLEQSASSKPNQGAAPGCFPTPQIPPPPLLEVGKKPHPPGSAVVFVAGGGAKGWRGNSSSWASLDKSGVGQSAAAPALHSLACLPLLPGDLSPLHRAAAAERKHASVGKEPACLPACTAQRQGKNESCISRLPAFPYYRHPPVKSGARGQRWWEHSVGQRRTQPAAAPVPGLDPPTVHHQHTVRVRGGNYAALGIFKECFILSKWVFFKGRRAGHQPTPPSLSERESGVSLLESVKHQLSDRHFDEGRSRRSGNPRGGLASSLSFCIELNGQSRALTVPPQSGPALPMPRLVCILSPPRARTASPAFLRQSRLAKLLSSKYCFPHAVHQPLCSSRKGLPALPFRSRKSQ